MTNSQHIVNKNNSGCKLLSSYKVRHLSTKCSLGIVIYLKKNSLKTIKVFRLEL